MSDQKPKNGKFYSANVEKLQSAIDSTGVSRSEIAAAGKLSRETLKKALDGKRITRAKANGIINGLKAHGFNGELNDLFSEIHE